MLIRNNDHALLVNKTKTNGQDNYRVAICKPEDEIYCGHKPRYISVVCSLLINCHKIKLYFTGKVLWLLTNYEDSEKQNLMQCI